LKASYKIVFALALAFFIVVILVLANGDGADEGLAGDGELAAQGDASDFQRNGPNLGNDLGSPSRTPTVVTAADQDKLKTPSNQQSNNQTPRATLGGSGSGLAPETGASSGISSDSEQPFAKRFGAPTNGNSEFQGFGNSPIRRPGQASIEADGDADSSADLDTNLGDTSSAEPVSRIATFGTSGRVSLGQKEPPVIEAVSGTPGDSDAAGTQAGSETNGVTGNAEPDKPLRLGATATQDAATTAADTTSRTGDRPQPAFSASLPKGVKAEYVSPSTGARKNYAIKTGDNFAVLSQRFYGSQRYWRSFSQANPKIDPTKMQVGQEIRLPNVNEIKRFAPDAVEQADRKPTPVPSTTKKHVVRSGQTLSGISKQHYGATKHWRFIYNTNKRVIGSNPNRLPAGETLVIPPLVTP